MPGALDDCINNVYEDGAIPASAGLEPVRVVLGPAEDPDDYDPEDEDLVYSLNFSKFWNSMYAAAGVI